MRGADRILREVLPVSGVDPRRYRAVLWAVDAVVSGGRVGLTAVGRFGRSATSVKHQIKRADRLVGNAHLHAEHMAWFEALLQRLTEGKHQIVLLLDWTHVGTDCALVASLPHSGRSIPAFFTVHAKHEYASPRVQADFLRALETLLPKGCRAILVTDAGFRGPWIQEIGDRFDFVTRVSGCSKLQIGEEDWRTVDQLAADAEITATDLGEVVLTTTNRLAVRAVRAKRYQPPTKRRRRRRKTGKKAYKEHKKAATQPWVLATSLREASAEDIVRLYALRMQIEEQFRDHKSHRFGIAMRYCRTCSLTRRANLLLLATLAALVLALVGRIAERNGLHRKLQANTERRRRVLSHQFLARAVLRAEFHRLVHRRELSRELARLRRALTPEALTMDRGLPRSGDS